METEAQPSCQPDVVESEKASGSHWMMVVVLSGAIASSIAFACLTFFLSTRHNDFPVQYHPDEWGKILQVRTTPDDWNFNHPLLMLHAAQTYCRWFHVPDESRAVSLAGRTTSALLTAIAVFAMTLAAWMRGRFTAMLLVGSCVAVCPSLIVHGHYFKEDTSLIFGIGITLFGAAMQCGAKNWRSRFAAAIVLGVGVALAISAKYVGVAVVIPAMVTLLMSPLRRWWLTLIQLTLFGVVGTLLGVWINSEAFEDTWHLKLRQDVREHIGDEYDHATASEWMHGQLVLQTPGTFCLRMAARQIGWPMWVLGSSAIILWIARPRFSRWLISVFAFIATFAIVLSFDAIPIPRYALPLTVLFSFACGASIAWAINARIASARYRVIAVCVAMLILFGCNLRTCTKLNNQFADDSRQRLREWIAKLPPGSVVVGERYTGLDNSGDPWRFSNTPRIAQILFPCNFAADFQSIDNLKHRRVNYLAIAGPAYERFLYPESKGATGQEARFAATQKFYQQLLREMKPIWQSDPDPPSDSYVNPAIRVYEITPPKQKQTAP